MGLLNGFHLISLSGRQGSGKTLLGKKLAHSLNVGKLEVSDVVRSLNKTLSREELPSTHKRTSSDPKWLITPVVESLIATNAVSEKGVIVLTGAREIKLLGGLEKEGALIWAIELHAEPITRCERLHRLGKVSTVEEFLAHEVRETQMGIKEVLEHCYARIITTDTSNPDDLVKQTIASLRKKKAI